MQIYSYFPKNTHFSVFNYNYYRLDMRFLSYVCIFNMLFLISRQRNNMTVYHRMKRRAHP